MPRHNSGNNILVDGHGNAREIHTSSSSSSSFAKNIYLKRKVLISKKRGSTTSVPSWRGHVGSPQCVVRSHESPRCRISSDGVQQIQVPVSARKLANALWSQINASQEKFNNLHDTRVINSRCVGNVSLHQHVCNQANCTQSELLDWSRPSNHNQMSLPIYQRYGIKKNNSVPADMLGKASLKEQRTISRVLQTEASLLGLTSIDSLVGGKKHPNQLRSSLIATKKLMKMFIQICRLLKQPDSAIFLARVIYCQLNQALVSADQLIHEKESEVSKYIHLSNQFVEENETRKRRKQEGIRLSFQSIIEGLETEGKLRRRAERKNEKLRVELKKVKSSLVKACEELESERKTREMIEQVCGQMIKEIGDDKAEVEELKKESVEAREELEKERQMLQLADELREERVQMKFSEAKYQYEEKNAAVDQLRCQLEKFLVAKRTKEPKNEPWDLTCGVDSDCAKTMHRSRSSSFGKLIMNNKEPNGENDEENVETESEDSDLHLIELNLDNNNNDSYCWHHASGDKLDLPSQKHGRSMKCEKVFGTYLPSEKFVYEGIHENSTTSVQHSDNNIDQGRQNHNIGIVDQSGERCTSVQVPEEQHTEDSRIVLPLTLPNSTKESSRQQALQNKLEQVCLASKVSEMLKAFRESESKASLGSMKTVHSELQFPIQ